MNPLSLTAISDYHKSGFTLIPTAFNPDELPEFSVMADENCEQFFEKDGTTLRSIYGFHRNPVFSDWLGKQIVLKNLVQELIGDQVYLHQSKINLKNTGNHSVWPFHRDFPFWRVFDNIRENKLVNAVVFLDDVSPENGELLFIPGSQLEFLPREAEEDHTEYSLEGSASDDLLFSFSEEEVDDFRKKMGVRGSTAPKGSLLLFNPEVLHGSGSASQNFSRKLMILTFNRCDNRPYRKSGRPEYLCNTDFTPIQWHN
jgi:ectoine hydroxylase